MKQRQRRGQARAPSYNDPASALRLCNDARLRPKPDSVLKLPRTLCTRLPLLLILALITGCAGLRYDSIGKEETPLAYGKVRYFLHEPTAENVASLGHGGSARDYLMESGWRYGPISTLDELLTAWGNPLRIEGHGNTTTYVFKNPGWAMLGLRVYPIVPIPIPVLPFPSRFPDTRVEVENGKIQRVSRPLLNRDFYGCVVIMPYPMCSKIDLNHVEY